MLRFISDGPAVRADGGRPTRRGRPPAAFFGGRREPESRAGRANSQRLRAGRAGSQCLRLCADARPPHAQGVGVLRFISDGSAVRADGGRAARGGRGNRRRLPRGRACGRQGRRVEEGEDGNGRPTRRGTATRASRAGWRLLSAAGTAGSIHAHAGAHPNTRPIATTRGGLRPCPRRNPPEHATDRAHARRALSAPAQEPPEHATDRVLTRRLCPRLRRSPQIHHRQ